MSQHLTPWFPGHIKPVRPGVYQQMDGHHGRELGYQRWDGLQWHSWCDKASDAARLNSPVAPSYQDDPWRGLAQNPKGTP